MSAWETNQNKDGSNSNTKKKREDELFIPNALETDDRLKVACSVAALLRFFHNKDFKGKTAHGDEFEECDKYHPSPISNIWLNILLKHPAKKLSIALTTILTHQEVQPSALGGTPPSFRHNRFLTDTLMVGSTRATGLADLIPPSVGGDEVSLHLLPRSPRAT
jgi:hypothetical protein